MSHKRKRGQKEAKKRLETGSYLLIRLIFGLPKEADVLDESGLDMLVIHELTENVELLPEKLVCEVYLEIKGCFSRLKLEPTVAYEHKTCLVFFQISN